MWGDRLLGWAGGKDKSVDKPVTGEKIIWCSCVPSFSLLLLSNLLQLCQAKISAESIGSYEVKYPTLIITLLDY